MVGGNAFADVMRTGKGGKNGQGVATSGEPVKIMELSGWLDYQSGQFGHLSYQAKVQDSTHVFVCDYDERYASLDENGLSLAIGPNRYEVLLIDDPMGMHGHIETYLKYTGGA